MFILKSISRKKYFLLIVTLVLALIILFALKACTKKGVTNWEIYSNSELGYEIQYPSNWYVKEEYLSECAEDPRRKNVKCSYGSLRIENIKKRVVVYGAGMMPETTRGSSFKVLIYEVRPHISSIEDLFIQGMWTIKDELRYYDEPKKFTPLEITRRDKEEYERKEKAHLNRVKENIQKKLNAVKEMKIGDLEIKAWEGDGWNEVESNNDLIHGIDFVHEGRLYRIRYMSGSQKQLKKDLDTFKKMLASFRIR